MLNGLHYQMNFTIAALHIAGLFSGSPMLSQTHSTRSVHLTKFNLQRLFSPVLYVSNPNFKNSISLSRFVHTNRIQEARTLEHEDRRERFEFSDIGLDVYDCFIQSRDDKANGGAFFIENERCIFTSKRCIYMQCTSGLSGGAIYVKAMDVFVTNSLFVDCACAQQGNVILARAHEVKLKASAIITNFPSSTALGEASVDSDALRTYLSNLNVTKMSCKTGDAFGKYISEDLSVQFCTIEACSFTNSLMTLSTAKLGFGYSNIIANTGADSEAMISMTGSTGEIRFAMNLFKDNTKCDTIFDHPESETKRISVYVIKCQFDCAEEDIATNETQIVATDNVYEKQDIVPHKLWRGDDSDYSRLPGDISESWVPTKAQSLSFNIWDDNNMAANVEVETFIRATTYWTQDLADRTETATAQPTEEVDHHRNAMVIAALLCIPLLLAIVGAIVYVMVKRSKDKDMDTSSSFSNRRILLDDVLG